MTRELWSRDGVPRLIHFMRASAKEGAVNQTRADWVRPPLQASFLVEVLSRRVWSVTGPGTLVSSNYANLRYYSINRGGVSNGRAIPADSWQAWLCIYCITSLIAALLIYPDTLAALENIKSIASSNFLALISKLCPAILLMPTKSETNIGKKGNGKLFLFL